MRIPKVHSTHSINFTKNAQFWTEMTNAYKRCYPQDSFKKMAKHLNLSETNARRYYYGLHQFNGGLFGPCYNQMRQGACVTVPKVA
jgi:hypothetical protein